MKLYRAKSNVKGSMIDLEPRVTGKDKHGLFVKIVKQKDWDPDAREGKGVGSFDYQNDDAVTYMKFSDLEVAQLIHSIDNNKNAGSNEKPLWHANCRYCFLAGEKPKKDGAKDFRGWWSIVSYKKDSNGENVTISYSFDPVQTVLLRQFLIDCLHIFTIKQFNIVQAERSEYLRKKAEEDDKKPAPKKETAKKDPPKEETRVVDDQDNFKPVEGSTEDPF